MENIMYDEITLSAKKTILGVNVEISIRELIPEIDTEKYLKDVINSFKKRTDRIFMKAKEKKHNGR